MPLLDYPIPKLDVTLHEASRVLQLTLSPEVYQQYKNALSQQREALQEAQKQLAAVTSGQENWATGQFKSHLLSVSDPLPTSTAIPSVLPPSKAKRECAQLERATSLLWAVAKLHSDPSLVEGDVPTERTQQSEVFAASRLPGESQDQLKIYPKSFHAILIFRGGVFPVQILYRHSSEGILSPLPLLDIYSQLVYATTQPAGGKEQDPSAICSLSALHRQAWHAVREEILRKGGAAAASLGLMESAVLALSLEDCDASPDLADTLNVVRLGRGDEQCLRYYDKVVNLVVFKDSTAGLVFEHSAVDGMVAGLVAEGVWYLSESQNLDHTKTQIVSNGPATLNDICYSPPKPLKFPLEGVTKPSQPGLGTSPQADHPIITFEIGSYPDVFTTCRDHRGLFDAWINFSVQLSLRQTLGDSAASHILVTPTHVRHYKHGRCDPTYSLTTQSRQLVGALASCIGPDNNPRYTKEHFQLFHMAFLEHKNAIKTTKGGHGVGPHLAALCRSMSQDNPLKKFLDPFGCPSVYITGKDLVEGVECAVGNVYASDQLAVTYLGRRDRVRIVLNGKGIFANVLEKLQESLKVTLKLVMVLALRYAIAGQMGAIDCLLQESEEGAMNGSAEEEIHKHFGSRGWSKAVYKASPSSDSASIMKPDFTLVIHGGAGEQMKLNEKTVGTVEFALRAALTLGAQVLSRGGSSLDAVQRCVEALEDCFLFNAGKGSVFNREGQHEMESTIVDGSGMKSGSVACLRRVKNPVKAARHVLEKSEHTLLVGDGAEEFLQGVQEKEKPVKAEYFHTDVQSQKLCSNAFKNNHSQAVGAVALDQWGKLAAATSTGGLVGKWKGKVGDTAVVGAGIYADAKLAVTCSGDGDVILRQTVAQKVASLYNLKGYSLRKACQEVIQDHLSGTCAGIIAVDHKGESVIETNAAVMFVGSRINSIARVEVITSADGPPATPEALKDIHTKITKSTAPRSWEDPQSHSSVAITNLWYRNLFQIQNTLYHSTVEFFHNICQYAYAMTPITTDCISSPMGLGSDSEPVSVNMLGQDVYLADSMQFVLEYFLRFQEGLLGTYYVSPSFRGEDPDATHLNQFYHVECELVGDMDAAMRIAEGYVAHMTRMMLKKHTSIILNTAGTLSHAQDLLKRLEGPTPFPRVTLDQAILMMPSADCLEWVQEGQPQFGRKLTRKGEHVLITRYGGAVWLTEMDHLGVPFYQAYVEGSGRCKAKAADLLLGLGETLGLGERHSTPEMVQEALRHHAVPEESYKWYIDMRQVIPLATSGWGMGTERYLSWLLQHNDVRDMHIIPRMKNKKYMP